MEFINENRDLKSVVPDRLAGAVRDINNGQSSPVSKLKGEVGNTNNALLPMSPEIPSVSMQRGFNASNIGVVRGSVPGNDGFSTELLRMNRFCMGIKRGNRYVCGSEVRDPDVVDKAVGLLTETIERLLRWRVWTGWWIDWWRGEWIRVGGNVDAVLSSRYGSDFVNSVLRLVDEFAMYIKELKSYWFRNDVGYEIRDLTNDLRSGRAKVIIWSDGSGFSVYGNHVTLSAHRVSNSVLVRLGLKGLDGEVINVPNIFRHINTDPTEVLLGLRIGFAATDEYVSDGKPAMTTTQPWQALLWTLLYPGRVRIRVDGINVNKGGITMSWDLVAHDHYSLRDSLPAHTARLSDQALPAIILTAVLGDGSTYLEDPTTDSYYRKPAIKITVSNSKFKLLEPILNRLGIKWVGSPHENGNAIRITISDDNAINLARAIIDATPPVLHDILDALDIKKWLVIKRIAEAGTGPGDSSIVIAGYGFTIHIRRDTLELRRRVSNWVKVSEVINALRARYGEELATNIRVDKDGDRLSIVIPARVIEKYGDIKAQTIKALCRKYVEARDETKRQWVAKALRRLAPTEGAAAARVEPR